MRILISLICCLLLAVPGLAQPVNEEAFLVAPYLQFSTQTGMYVLWETRDLASTRVDFGEARAQVTRAVLDRSASLPGNRQMHEVLLAELKPETNYFWRTTSVTTTGDTLRSALYTFKTAVRDSSAYMFALIGDTQRNSRTPWAWEKIADLVWEDRPNFVVLAGDLVDQGLDKNDWLENFFPKGRPLLSRVPVYPVLGNHEQDASYYYQYVVAPPPEYYYTFTYGNAQFFMIDTNRDVSEGSEQYDWLEWALAKSTATWKIAVHHHPPYSSDSDDHGDTYQSLSTLGTDARNLVPLYERYGLDFCLFGHTHLYERSWPIKDNQINMKNGVVYINSGGAGGGLEAFAPTRSWFTAELQSVHHYCTFSIFADNVIFKSIDHEGRMLDAFQMQKEKDRTSSASVLQPPAPHVVAAATLFEKETVVTLEAPFEDIAIHYTTDGSEPTRSSARYTKPFTLSNTATVRARSYTADGRASRVKSLSFRKMAPLPPVKTKKTEPGLAIQYFEGSWTKLPDFTRLKPVKTGVVKQVSLADTGHRPDEFALVLEGFVDIATSGVQTFYLNSDDGSKLYIDNQLVVDHDGDHSAIKKTGQIILAPGKHTVRIEYMEVRGSQFLQAGIIDGTGVAVPFSPFQLSH
jgi:predicted phosphodiesterase